MLPAFRKIGSGDHFASCSPSWILSQTFIHSAGHRRGCPSYSPSETAVPLGRDRAGRGQDNGLFPSSLVSGLALCSQLYDRSCTMTGSWVTCRGPSCRLGSNDLLG